MKLYNQIWKRVNFVQYQILCVRLLWIKKITPNVTLHTTNNYRAMTNQDNLQWCCKTYASIQTSETVKLLMCAYWRQAIQNLYNILTFFHTLCTWKFDHFIVPDPKPQGGYLVGSRPMLSCVSLCPLIT